MASLKNIKLKILSYKKTGTVTHAMEAVSAVKMRKAQERALGGRAYAAVAFSILERLSSVVDIKNHYLFLEGAKNLALKSCYVVITSDKGLAGALNSGVIRLAEQHILSSGIAKENIIIIAIGRRASDYFVSRGYTIARSFINVSDNISESDVKEISHALIELKRTSEISSAYIVYQNFISTFEQAPSVRQIIPITQESMREIVAGIRPAKGKYAPQENARESIQPSVYTFEPNAEQLLAVLPQLLLNVALFHPLLESKASEHSARMVAMKSATDKAKDMAKSYTRTFNKVRQAAITAEVSEITSGMEAMK